MRFFIWSPLAARRLLLGGLLLAGPACHQRNGDPAPAGCQLSVTDGSLNSYQYDEQGRLATVRLANSSVLTYTYQGSQQATLKVTYPGLDYLYQQSTLTLDGQGRLVAAQETRYQQMGSSSTFQPSPRGDYTFAYDAQGRLTDYRATNYSQPVGQPSTTTTSHVQLRYQAGNPVEIVRTDVNEYRTTTVFTSTLTYGNQANLLRLPLLAENLGPGRFLPAQWLGLAGQPPAQLLTSQHVVQDNSPQPAATYQYAYTYQLDAKGQVLQISYPPYAAAGPVAVASTCY